MKIDREQWSQISVLLDAALDIDLNEREAWLQRLPSDASALKEPLRTLLAQRAHIETGEFLKAPDFAAALRVESERSQIPPVELQAASEVGAYRLLRELGRGGMGSVWLAERIDGKLKRQVALKFPYAGPNQRQLAERLARERDILAGLEHPNIARLYDADVTALGQPFLVLEYVDGIPINDYCDQHRLTIRERLVLFLQVLNAVQYAHTHLVIHRDLKPSNILITSDRVVRLLDFGIAKLVSEGEANEAALTQFGGRALTPDYASPEQIAGLPITTTSDVYSLGVVLYELLTGNRPYRLKHDRNSSLEDAVRATEIVAPSCAPSSSEIAVQRAVSERQLTRALRGDIDAIVLKALEKTSTDRYASAEHLADDLRRFLASVPIAARPHAFAHKAQLFVRRHRNASIATTIGIIVSIGVASLALQQHLESRAHEMRAAVVRDFMFDLVEDAEPNESQPDAPVTGRQMLDGAVLRAREFRKQPRLQGELLAELGRMYGRLNEAQLGMQTLNEALALLENNSAPGDPALNKARAYLAQALLAENEVNLARELATAARDHCTGQNTDCAKARAYANDVLGEIYLMEGKVDQGLLALRAAVRETTLGFGENDAQTALELTDLAVAARNAGHLQEAAIVMDRATAIVNNQTLASADRDRVTRMAAVLDLDLGRYDEAQRRFKELIAKAANPSNRAVLLRLFGNVLLAQGEPQAALDAAEAALSIADPSKLTAEALFVHQARARAFALLARDEDALAEIEAVIQGLPNVGYSSDAPETLRARRIRGEILLRAGRFAEAFAELESLTTQLRRATNSPDLELGQTLDLVGCAQRALNRPTDAAASHTLARAYLKKNLPADHPLLQRNTLYHAMANGNREQFVQQAKLMRQSLPGESIWRRLIDAQLDPASDRTARSPAFVL